MNRIIIKILLICLTFFNILLPSFGQEDVNENLKAGIEYYKQYKLDLAEEEYKKALDFYTTKKDEKGKAICYIKLAEVCSSLNLYGNSLNYYDKAFEIFKKLSDKKFHGEILINKGDIYHSLGRYDKSLLLYLKALEFYKNMSDKTGEGIALEHIGDLYNDLSSYEIALAYHENARNCFSQANDNTRASIVLCKTGEDYLACGKKDQGLQKLQEAIDLSRNDTNGPFDILMIAGNVWKNNKYYDEALEMYRGARDIVRAKGDKNSELKILIEIARTDILKGDDDNALGIYEKIIELAGEVGDNGQRINALLNSGIIYEKHYKPEKALEVFNECLEFYKSVEDKWGLINTYERFGDLYEKQGQIDLAGQNYIEAIRQIEELRGEIKLEEFKESFTEKVMPFYKKVINFFLRSGNYKEAFNYLEMGRARALLDALTAGKVNIKQGAKPELLEKDKKLQAELNYLQKALVKEISLQVQDDERIKELKDKLAGASKELKSVQQELILSSPSYASITGIKKPLTLEEVQNKVLKEKQFLLEYLINDDNLYVWVISKKSFSFIEIPVSESELEKKIDDFRQPFKELRQNMNGLWDIMPNLSSQNLHDLYNILFKPVSDKVSFPLNAELIIVPDGKLYSIPFETLVVEIKAPVNNSAVTFGNFSGNKYLIQDYNISYSPSASALDPDLIGKRKKCDGLYLAFGNPDFSNGNKKQTPQTQVEIQNMVTSTEPQNMTGSILLFQGSEDNYLPPLPATETQVKDIGKFFKKLGKIEIYVKANATEEKFRSKCSNYKYILLATHGLWEENDPMQSSLVFTLSSSSSEDGFLRASDILNLNINSDLVVLSACETGLGQIKTGEGVIGLTRSFMYAGTPSIVVSLWNVESISTARLIEIFYKKLLSGMSKSEALRQAKLEIMKEVSVMGGQKVAFCHPFFWAPFVIVGKSN